MNLAFTVIMLILLRLGFPIALMILFGYFLHQLDNRWQEKAREAPKGAVESEAGQDMERPVHI